MKRQATNNIENYLHEIKNEVFELIKENKNLLISSNPASGKTTLFAQLCIDNKSSEKNNRVIFCAPYLIIQEQFKHKLKESGVVPDFELNGSSVRKQLNKKDKIITSTFKSFQKISEHLDSEDIVIIDEAHSLLNVFSNLKQNKHDHFGNFYKALKNTKAKVVLMTGTPVDSFFYWFDNLLELKVFKESPKAKVKIHYSSLSSNDIVIQFADDCIKEFGVNSLNVIYVKSKNKCEKNAEILNSLGYKCLILTSDTKLTDEYQGLVETSLISNNFQFLLTTNVISTGTNILNENMGKALMLNEYDPIEIKQFSKRFRKKLNIEIDVVNKEQKNAANFPFLRNEIIKKRNENRKYLKGIEQNLNANLINYKSDEFNFNEFGGEASQLNPKNRQDAFIKRNLLQEIYYHQEITKTYNDRTELTKALNEFDDIISIEILDYKKEDTNHTFDEKAYQNNKKEYFNDVINSFIEQPEAHLFAFSNYIQVHHKYSKLENINIILEKFELAEDIFEDSKTVDISPPLVNIIIKPLLDYYPFFLEKDPRLSITRCLNFIKNVPPNRQSKHIISLWFNEKFRDYLKVPENYSLEHQNLVQIKPIESKNEDLIYFLINQTFLFIMGNEEIYYQDFKNSFINSSKNRKFYPDEYFPWIGQLTLFEGSIIDIDNNLGFGLLYSIFAIKINQVQRSHPKVRNSKRVNTFLPADLESVNGFKCLNEEELKRFLLGLTSIKTNPPTRLYQGFNLNETERVLIDKEYLTIIASQQV